ncbi:MAG: TonB-dependent receptor [Chitinophagales bacterium]|nr:TonB-dependent receptor [Chitinophagales bacterium]
MQLLLCCASLCLAQEATIKGKVIARDSKESIPSATIMVEGTTTMVEADSLGNFVLKVPAGTVKLKASFIGYYPTNRTVKVEDGEVKRITIELAEDLKELNLVVVSGSRYEKKIGQETVSVEVLSQNLIKNTNAVDASDVVAKTPGVNIVDGQASIRGGTGFSYGVGSRVLLLVDDQPLLDGALGDARWKFIPIENAEQIEVIKGASSVLYGSSALNGIIHVRTGYAKKDPETSIQLYTSLVDNPARKETKWWDFYSQPFSTGGFISHKQRFGRFDLTAGANFHGAKSYLEKGDEFRIRGNFKTRYRPVKSEGLSFGINGNIMFERSGRFFLWVDADTGIYQISQGSGDKYILMNLDPWITYYDKKGNKQRLLTRYYRTFRFGDKASGTEPAISNLFYADYQYQRNIKKTFVITTGTTGSVGVNTSNLFPGRRVTAYGAVFGQFEFKYNKLSLLAGLREEVNKVDTLVELSNPVFRAGLNYQAGKTTYIRASWGQGFRFPTVGERFLDDNLAGLLQILPNPDLKPEKGWSAEIGLKQGVKISRWLGYLDVSIFWMEYKDLIEYYLALPDSGFFLGFRPDNADRARIAGYEVSLVGQGDLGPVTFRSLIGYTYSYPGDIVNDSSQRNIGTYLKNFFRGMGGIQYDDPESQSVLRYRNMNLIRLDVEFLYKWASIGYSLNYTSFMANYDDKFKLIGLTDYIEKRQGKRGDLVMDIRASAKLSEHVKFAFLIKNLTNLEYANRPGIMNSPRNYTLQFSYNF